MFALYDSEESMSIRAVGPQVEEGATPAGSARVKRRKKAERPLDSLIADCAAP